MSENNDEDQRLKRIKFLVEQSKLYAKFLTESLEPENSVDEGNNFVDKQQDQEEQRENVESLTNDDTHTFESIETSDLKANDQNLESRTKKRKTEKVNTLKTKKGKATQEGAKLVSSKDQQMQPTITSFYKRQNPLEEHAIDKSSDKAERHISNQPSRIVVSLHPHQKVALKWLTLLYQNGLNGILADEMGLGKTLEVIAFLAFLLENGVNGPFLVLCPLSVVGNWCNEIDKFAPSITYTKYCGTPKERSQLRRASSSWGEVIISSYETIMADAKPLNKIGWKYIIVDEGHRLKNINSKLMQVLKQFKSANRMLLTGTPLQNNLPELWSLLNFLMPDIFVDLNIFHTWFESDSIHIDSENEEGLITSIHDILRPFLLRRLKKDVGLSLPPKREYILFTGLTLIQQELYQSILDKKGREYVRNQIIQESEKLTRNKPANAGSKSSSSKRNIDAEEKDREELTDSLVKAASQEMQSKSFANMLMQLRLTCNSPYLFWDPFILQQNHKVDARIESSSAKLILLHRIMSKLKSAGHKVLIFTQFSKTLDILEDWAIYRGYSYARLDGSTKQLDRQYLMDEFNKEESEIDLFMLTTRSGGQGVNLIKADTVVLFDSDWNPQQDLQAMDRVHRIGQTKPVIVLRLSTTDTVEQNLLARAAQKLELNQLIIESGHFKGPMSDYKTNKEKIDVLNTQIQRYKGEYSSSSIDDDSLDLILDRSLAAYQNSQPQSKITDNIFCVSSVL